MRKSIGIALTAVLALLVVPAAWAGSGMDGYGGNAGTIQGAVHKSGNLPFTGLNLTTVLIIGVLLIAAGVVLHRRGSRTGA